MRGLIDRTLRKLTETLPIKKLFKLVNVSAAFNGNNYASIPASKVPSEEYVLIGIYNGGFTGNPRWPTSIAYQNGNWVIHSDTAVPGTMTITTFWVHGSLVNW